jgi:hypothetical protein
MQFTVNRREILAERFDSRSAQAQDLLGNAAQFKITYNPGFIAWIAKPPVCLNRCN